MWGWADPLVEQATKAVYEKVFSVFGVITLAIVGLYLLWRSRQADMGAAMTTAGWAILVMVAVTAIAAWPVTLREHRRPDARSPRSAWSTTPSARAQDTPADQCDDSDARRLRRTTARRPSGPATPRPRPCSTATGCAACSARPTATTAQKYGRALYDAKSLTWDEAAEAPRQPGDP